jgi:hypothetical protein
MDGTERLVAALRAGDDGDQLGEWVKAQFANGRAKAEIMDAIIETRERLRAENSWREIDEDGFVNVLDAMTGWCHPSAWLCPPD